MIHLNAPFKIYLEKYSIFFCFIRIIILEKKKIENFTLEICKNRVCNPIYLKVHRKYLYIYSKKRFNGYEKDRYYQF